jgi:low temperature requirement protein LtrA
MQIVRPIRLVSTESGQSRRASWLELFFDLIFVAAVAQVSVPLRTDYTVQGLARYALMFLLIWWAWVGHTIYSSRFDSDDVVHRILTFVQMFAAAAMAANAKAAFDSRDSAGFGAAYAVLRTVQAVQYVRARRLSQTRRLTTLYAAGFGMAATLWAVAAIVPAPARFWLWGAALLADLSTPWAAVRYTHKFPPHAEHLPERFGLFTIILLGESVAAVMRGMESQETWTVSAAIAAIAGLGLAFGYWWWYFDGVKGAGERQIKSRRSLTNFHIWTYVHFPLYLSIAVVGVGVEHVISLPPSGRLNREDTFIVVAAASLVMTLLQIVGLTSALQQNKGCARVRVTQLFVCLLAIPAIWISAALPPSAVLVWLLGVCAAGLVLVDLSRPALSHRERAGEESWSVTDKSSDRSASVPTALLRM